MGSLRSADPLAHADPMSGARLTRYQQLAEEIADGIRAGFINVTHLERWAEKQSLEREGDHA